MKVKFTPLIILLFQISLQHTVAQNSIEKTRVMILGTEHLAQRESFDPGSLDPLIDNLNAHEFNAVCIENMSLELLKDLSCRNDPYFEDVLSSFGGHRIELARKYQSLLKLDRIEAEMRIDSILGNTISDNTTRKNLILLFLANGDIASATLQYEMLKIKNADVSDLGEETTKLLSEYAADYNEINLIGLRVAMEQNLDKVEYIDDFQDEAILLRNFPFFIDDFQQNPWLIQEISENPIYKKQRQISEVAGSNNDLLPLYLFINSPEFTEGDKQAQWDIWLRSNFKSNSDRARYALWEMRNLDIAANIARTAAFYPGQKILVIIGVSHKYFLDRYLGQLADIEIIHLRQD